MGGTGEGEERQGENQAEINDGHHDASGRSSRRCQRMWQELSLMIKIRRTKTMIREGWQLIRNSFSFSLK